MRIDLRLYLWPPPRHKLGYYLLILSHIWGNLVEILFALCCGLWNILTLYLLSPEWEGHEALIETVSSDCPCVTIPRWHQIPYVTSTQNIFYFWLCCESRWEVSVKRPWAKTQGRLSIHSFLGLGD
jgi:hypothetical protein